MAEEVITNKVSGNFGYATTELTYGGFKIIYHTEYDNKPLTKQISISDDGILLDNGKSSLDINDDTCSFGLADSQITLNSEECNIPNIKTNSFILEDESDNNPVGSIRLLYVMGWSGSTVVKLGTIINSEEDIVVSLALISADGTYSNGGVYLNGTWKVLNPAKPVDGMLLTLAQRIS